MTVGTNCEACKKDIHREDGCLWSPIGSLCLPCEGATLKVFKVFNEQGDWIAFGLHQWPAPVHHLELLMDDAEEGFQARVTMETMKWSEFLALDRDG